MDNNLQNVIEDLRKALEFKLSKFDLVNSNMEILKFNDLGEKMRSQIFSANQNIGDYLRRAGELGNSLKSTTENWNLDSLVEQIQHSMQNLGVKGNFNSSAGVSHSHFDTFDPLKIEQSNNSSGIFWN